MKKLYVGNIPFSCEEHQLTDIFSKSGTVESVQIIQDKVTNRSKGFGFVEMSSEDEANKAVEDLNGYELSGRNLVVSIARPKESSPRSGGFGGGGGGRGGFGGGGGGGGRRGGGGGFGKRSGGGFGGGRGGNRRDSY